MLSIGRACVAVVSTLAMLAAGSADRPLVAHQGGVASERTAGPTVDFIAVQADGTPLVDLQASEVEVRIQDRVRRVRSLRRVTAAPNPIVPDAAPVAAPYGTNDNVTAGRTFALIVDQESIPPGAEQLLRSAVAGLLAQLTPADQTMVAALPFDGVKVAFTSDTARIGLAMDAVAGQGSRNETGSELACRTRRFLESLDAFLKGQARRASPLTVVLFTAGLAGPRRDAPMALAPGMCELLVDHFQRLALSASAARANVYVLQPADIGMSAGNWRESISGAGYLGSDNPLEGIEHLAGTTGGARFPLDATGTGALLRVARESAAFFEAELEPERGEAFGRSRSLAVHVTRSGVTVRARPRITFAEEPRRAGRPRLTVSDLLASTEPATELRLRVAGFTMSEAAGGLRVGVVVETVDPSTSLTSVGAILSEPDGLVVSRWFASDPAERPLLGAMAAVPGTYTLRVGAIDTAGRAGVAEEIVSARLTPVGPLYLGSLMLGVSRNEATVAQLEFGSEPTAIASLDIYGGTAGLRLSATLEVARTPEGPALVAVPLALARVNDARVLAMGALPIGALSPGDYVVRGIIRLDDGTTGRVVRTLRKVAR